MTWIFYAKSDDEKLTSTYVAWYKIRVQLAIIVIVEILTPTNDDPSDYPARDLCASFDGYIYNQWPLIGLFSAKRAGRGYPD